MLSPFLLLRPSSPSFVTLWFSSFSFFCPHATAPLLFVHFLSLSLSFLSLTAANKKQQSMDAAVLHLFPPHRQLLCAQHVCGRGGGKLSQVSPTAGGGGGTAEGGEATEALGEEEEK